MTDAIAADSNGANDNLIIENRAMHSFSIPAQTFHSCACGQIWEGPAFTCIDNQGHFWNCKGCEDRFKSLAQEETMDSVS